MDPEDVKKNFDNHNYLPRIPGKYLPPMIAVVGFSGQGKTTLTVKIVAEFKRRGFRVGTIKHDAHGFDLDHPGKDSWRHKQAGASVTIVTSPTQVGMVRDVDHDHQPEELVPFLVGLDIVLVEGFKRSKLPKIEIFRPEIKKEPACKDDKHLIALVSDSHLDWGVPRFHTEQIFEIVSFLSEHLRLKNPKCFEVNQGLG
ncbi:MAG: molybdopterin-guanine dinucleotide biosynthesis protein B [Desulfobacterales bacterium]